jgi:hypothetical protein
MSQIEKQAKPTTIRIRKEKTKKPATIRIRDKVKYIKSLWLGAEHFSGRFTGSVVFRNALRVDKGIDIPYKEVCRILHEIPTFVQSTKRRYIFPRRHYHAEGFASLLQADLGEMASFDNKKSGCV